MSISAAKRPQAADTQEPSSKVKQQSQSAAKYHHRMPQCKNSRATTTTTTSYAIKLITVCLIILLLTYATQLSLATSAQTKQQQQVVASANSSSPTTTTAASKQTKSTPSASEQQAADMSSSSSSVYVQIPIAEPIEQQNSNAAEQQQQLVVDGTEQQQPGDATKATTWTGPWPKKFQIGYIKQSDLHQVLIESLKNDPFIGKTAEVSSATVPPSGVSKTSSSSKSAPAAATTPAPIKSAPIQPQTAPPSDASSLMAYPQLKAVQQQSASLLSSSAGGDHQQPGYRHANNNQFGRSHQALARPLTLSNLYAPQVSSMQHQQRNNNAGRHQQAANHYRHAMMLPAQQGNNHFHGQQQFNHQMGHLLHGPALPFNVQRAPFQQVAKMQPFVQQQQNQFQFAGFQKSNQPIYTMNNNNHAFANQQLENIEQQQPQQHMQLMQNFNNHQQQQLNRRPHTKSSGDYYSSSWRPVTTSGENDKQQQQQQQVSEFGDGFDDGFGMPQMSKEAIESMNRHPVLNTYLSDNASGKVSSAKAYTKQHNLASPASRLPTTKTTTKTIPMNEDKFEQQQQQIFAADDLPLDSTKSSSGRRAVGSSSNGTITSTTTSATTSTTTTSTPATSNSSATTTPTPVVGDTNNSTSVVQQQTDSSPTSTTVPSSVEQSTTTSNNAAAAADAATDAPTTEPDSEVFESEMTEPSDQEIGSTTTTTTASSLDAASRSSTTTAPSILQSATTEMGPVQAEVFTQSSNSAPTAQSTQDEANSGGDQTREETTPASLAGASQTTTTTTTTPSSSEQSSQAVTTSETTASDTKGASEVEGTGASENQSTTAAPARKASDATLSDEALVAAAVRASDVTKSAARSASLNGGQRQPVSAKKARSSERLVQQQQVAAGATKSGPTTTNNKTSNKLITRKPAPSQRAAKQIVSPSGAKGGSVQVKSASLKSERQQKNKKKTSGRGTTAAAKATATNKRMAAPEQQQQQRRSDKLQQQQVVSMSAAQAQSTAQTLASLLLSRCLSSTNCAHLLDVCTTKQAAVPLSSPSPQQLGEVSLSSSSTQSPQQTGNTLNANWSMPIGLMSSNLMSLMQALRADKVLRLFPAWRDTIENIVDQDAQTGYTLIMPSNDAIERMPLTQIDTLLANADLMSQLIENHIIDSVETIDLFQQQQQQQTNDAITSQQVRTSLLPNARSRYVRNKGIQINQHRDRMVTMNGKRVLFANQLAPAGGRIHVIDGLLDWPSTSLVSSFGTASAQLQAANGNAAKLLDIMDTLKQCDKFDGFVTLAEGTGLAQLLKQDEPLTVFVPSNEALRKIPDDELEVIKNNSTALREFIMYHIVNGSYFSQDLRDGQQLASILDMRPIQVGVRVDGCSRRLVEANTSPMRRPDIVAKNGVIHILDWYLTVRDNEWCDPIGRAAQVISSSSSAASAPTSGQSTNDNQTERLQQLSSEHHGVLMSSSTSISSTSSSLGQPTNQRQPLTSNAMYATRMSMPPNHKAAATHKDIDKSSEDNQLLEANDSVYVSSLPVNEHNNATPMHQ